MILLAACYAGPARAASVSMVAVTAPQNVLLCGSSMQLQASAWNWYGGPVTGFVPQWQSSNPGVATVDVTGTVKGLLPGLVTIQATDPATGIGSSYILRVEPLRIAITPAHPVLRAGGSLQLSASALDANGAPIAGVQFQWSSGVTDIATVSKTGAVSALQPGDVTISAALSTGSPGLNFTSDVQVSVLRKADYQLKALVTSDLGTSGPTLVMATMISASGDNLVAAVGDLSNGGQGLILTSHGVPQLLASSGQFLPGVNRFINRFSGVSVNSAGDVAASVYFPSGCDSAVLFFHQGHPPAVLDFGCGINLTDRALGNNGDVIYTMWTNGQQCYIHHSDGTRTPLVKAGDNFSGSLIAGNFGRAMLTASGTSAILEIYPVGASDQLWLWNGSSFQNLASNGGNIGVGQVQNFQFPVESATGDLYSLMNLTSGSSVLRYSKGKWTFVAAPNSTVGNTQLWWIYQIAAAGSDGSIAVLADSPNGTGVYRLTSGNPVLLGAVQNSLNVMQLEGAGSGVLDAGRITGTAGVYLLTAGATPVSILSAGWQFPSPGTLSFLWDQVPERASTTNPLMRQPGDGLARVSSGAWQSLAKPGGTAGGDTINWIGTAATSPDGKNTVFAANTTGGNAFFNAQSGGLSLIGDITNHQIPIGGQKITWIDPNWSGPFAMNSNQQFVAMGNVGSSTSLIRVDLTGATSQQLAILQQASPLGLAYSWINSAAIDESGNVAFIASLSDGSSALFFWKNGQARMLLRNGGTSLQGNAPISGISNFYQFAGSKLAVLVWYQNAGTVLQVFDGTSWQPLITQGQTLTFGRSIDNFTGNLAASDNGDIAYTASTHGYPSLLVHTHDGRDLIVADATGPLPDGSWPIGFYGFNMTPQGSLIFAAESYSNGKSHLTLFAATPAP